MKIKNFLYLHIENTLYYISLFTIHLLKYLLFFIIISFGVIFFLQWINPEWIEAFFWPTWQDRDIWLWVFWNWFKKIFNIILQIPLIISLCFCIYQVFKQKLYFEWKKHIIETLIAFFLWFFYLIYFSLKENKNKKFKRFHLLFYSYIMIFIIQVSWFLWWAFWDILTILSYSAGRN